MKDRKIISFDWAMKRLLRNKANFEVLEGFLSELLRRQIIIKNIGESEGHARRMDILPEKQPDKNELQAANERIAEMERKKNNKRNMSEKRNKRLSHGILSLLLILGVTLMASCDRREAVYVPVLDGEWQSITDMPDLGEYNAERQQPVDFTVWKAKDGTWQLWSCVRGTKYPGRGRLFYRWEGSSLTDKAWKPMGIAMEADTTLGEMQGGLQAPYVFEEDGVYYMFYGDWNNICLAKSDDGKNFTRVLNENNNAALFSGPLYNTRDPMVLKVADTYYCYYCAHNEIDNGAFEAQGAIYCRTSGDMKKWSEPVVVSRGGSPLFEADCPHCDMECPFVLPYKDKYILFRSQLYGRNRLNTQYCSGNPLDFGDGHDDFRVGRLYVAAPEVIKEGDQYYVVSLKRRLNGMEIAKLKIVEEKRDQY